MRHAHALLIVKFPESGGFMQKVTTPKFPELGEFIKNARQLIDCLAFPSVSSVNFCEFCVKLHQRFSRTLPHSIFIS